MNDEFKDAMLEGMDAGFDIMAQHTEMQRMLRMQLAAQIAGGLLASHNGPVDPAAVADRALTIACEIMEQA